MNQSNNGESVSEPHRHKPKRHNAKLCPFAIRQRIVNALANGDSIRAIARGLHVSNNTAVAIREQDWQQVEARKARLAAQWEQVATKAVDQLNDHLDASTLPPNALVPIAGVATDKLLALRGDSSLTQIQQNLHLHLQSVDVAGQFNAFLAELDKRHLTSKNGGPEFSVTPPPNVSGNGNLSGDAPPFALTDETTEQRE